MKGNVPKRPRMPAERDNRKQVRELFGKLKRKLPDLDKLLAESNDPWGCEDAVYRFYHQSWKVFELQDLTAKIVRQLKSLLPGVSLNGWFLGIVREGTGKRFSPRDNETWTAVTRPILEAFFHARYFLEMAVRYGRELKFPPNLMPSGWAALLYLYNLR